jgi:hypothetical protein
MKDLLLEVARLGDDKVAALLCITKEFINQWKPREHYLTKRLELGYEPSQGFIAAALSILRNN